MYTLDMENNKNMTNDWRKAGPKDLNTFKVINGRTYKGVAEAIQVGPDEFETQVRWHLAKLRDLRKRVL